MFLGEDLVKYNTQVMNGLLEYLPSLLPPLFPSLPPPFLLCSIQGIPLEAQEEGGIGAAGIQRKGRVGWSSSGVGEKNPSHRLDLREGPGLGLLLPVKSYVNHPF